MSGWRRLGDVGIPAKESTMSKAKEPAEAPAFDPRPHVRQLRGRGGNGAAYLDAKWRIAWLRAEYPESQIATELVKLELQPGLALFKATVVLQDQNGAMCGSATGYGSETQGDFNDFIEKAETKALGRALHHLGFSVAHMQEDASPSDAPVERRVAVDPELERKAELGAYVSEQIFRTGLTPEGVRAISLEVTGHREWEDMSNAERERLLVSLQALPDAKAT